MTQSLKRSRNAIHQPSGTCDACGGYGPWSFEQIINEELARVWNLSKEARRSMSARESMKCIYCGSSYRLRLLARALNHWVFSNTERSLLENITNQELQKSTAIAEINSCGVLHEILRRFDNLYYSEYQPTKGNGKIPHQDIQKLTYKSDIFDVVLTSDVLEHVPDIKKSLAEVYRVLKPSGAYIFTVPLVHGRASTVKASMKGSKLHHHGEASYHGAGQDDYLVWHEFGDDFKEMVNEAGFIVHELFVSTGKPTDTTGVFLAIKPPTGRQIASKDTGRMKINAEQQLNVVGSLHNKLLLTENHANNLSQELNVYKEEYAKAMAIIESSANNGVIKRSLAFVKKNTKH